MPKIIIVTGVSRGIGRSIVDKTIELSDDSIVFGVARSETPLKELKEKYGDRFHYAVGDITDENVINKLVKDAIATGGKIDSVVANAGVLEPVQDVNNIDVNAWKRLFDINFFSVVALTSATLPYLKKTNGNIIFVSSDASDTHFSSWGAYSASKACINRFAMTVGHEEPAVKCLSVAPGIVDTSMQVNIRENVGTSMSAEHHQMFKDLKETNKLASSEDVATVYSKLALNGIPKDLNGTYISYDDPLLKDFA
ncbi:sepiapterin reductase family protein NDAI_0C00130 [Naumovozyma dairenensis CBS 421]|uniref:Uncharacterized protein n=1 Tax=Naumovozyma dairenensis (strain ATCC 10597 / BCRC 20456 / CBS 421 / NBRC 0211 / NRRL Y-12639) TaxID=1071378 RepID=G0W7B2_NAUDC|nr:hypothetical protein NDAI_0C00130 [Naumovozyma dairenensis CBS 421]CCD23673.1 hypothetical protein NDAI_0C00130 [Naumovozyma dairenensis CBS 421]